MYISNEQIQTLMDSDTSGNRLSIYIPTTRQSNTDTLHQDKTRLKNVFAEAKRTSKGQEKFFKTAENEVKKLIDDIAFWKHQDRGLAVFISDNRPLYPIPLPYATTEFANFSNRYCVAPLLLQSSINRDFYLIDCNLTKPRLLRSLGNTLEEIELENMPASFAEEFAHVEYKQELQHRGAPRDSTGTGAFHAHDPSDNLNKDIEKYLSDIAKVVDSYLKDESAPLIIAGTIKRAGFLRSKIKYQALIESIIEGDHSTANEQALYDQAKPVADEYHKDQRQTQVDLVAKADPRLLAHGHEQIAQAISENRAETLFVPSFRITTDGTSPGYQAHIVMQDNVFLDEIEQLCRDITANGGTVVATDQASSAITEPTAICRFPADA